MMKALVILILSILLSSSAGAVNMGPAQEHNPAFKVSPAQQGLNAVVAATAGSTIDLTGTVTGVLGGPTSISSHKCVTIMGGTSVSAMATVVQGSYDGSTWFGIPGSWASPAISKVGTYESGGNGWYPFVRCNLITFTGSSPTATVYYFGFTGKQEVAPGAYFRCTTTNNSATSSTTVSTDTGSIGGVSSTTACANASALASIAMSITSITFTASVASTTTASQYMIIQVGTSTACTSPVVIWSAYGTAFGGGPVRFAPGEMITPNANSLCFLHAATGSKSVTVVGIYGPWNG